MKSAGAGRTSRIELGVDGELPDGTKDLRQTADDDLGKEEGEEDLDGGESDKTEAGVVAID